MASRAVPLNAVLARRGVQLQCDDGRPGSAPLLRGTAEATAGIVRQSPAAQPASGTLPHHTAPQLHGDSKVMQLCNATQQWPQPPEGWLDDGELEVRWAPILLTACGLATLSRHIQA
jgi:hypothetical protein